jgi:hypothetical protein
MVTCQWKVTFRLQNWWKLIAYVTALHQSQFCVFFLSVVLYGEKGGLLRWDHSGVIYTEAFEWAEQPDMPFFEFFRRIKSINFLSPVDRGYDTTVTPHMDDDNGVKAAIAAILKLRIYKCWEKSGNLRRITVPGFGEDCHSSPSLVCT